MSGLYCPRIHRQSGFSLIELMIAMLIGLFLLFGVVQIFMGSRLTYQAHEGIGRIQENGRFAIEIMSRQVRMAGFRSQPLSGTSLAAVNGRNNVAAGGTDNALAGTDKLILVYQGATDGGTTNCLGNAVTANATTTVVFLVDANRTLRCAVDPANIDEAVGQPILEGVSDMQLLFGEQTIDSSTNPPTRSYRYVTANNVTTWGSVISVRIQLSVDSVETFNPDLPDDGRLALPYSTTVTIRNRT